MALQSIGSCPWCMARVDMKKQNGAFQCPVCGCRYRHNWVAWIVAFPLAMGVALIVFQKLHTGLFSACSGAIVAIITVSRMGIYRISNPGNKEVTIGAVLEHKPEKKESRWVIVFMVLLLVAVAAFFCFAVMGT